MEGGEIVGVRKLEAVIVMVMAVAEREMKSTKSKVEKPSGNNADAVSVIARAMYNNILFVHKNAIYIFLVSLHAGPAYGYW